MIVILKPNPNPDQLESLKNWLLGKGIQIHTSLGTSQMILGLVGDTSTLDIDLISALDIVEDVKRVQEPYKNANRKFHPEDAVIPVGNTQIGGGTLTIMAGPCSVESEEQIVTIAKHVKAAGAQMLRGGAFKPRTSPYAFQGLGVEGLRYLAEERSVVGLPVITEVMDTRDVEMVAEFADIIQVGARNMQNFNLLKVLGRCHKPVMLKRGLASTLEELLMSAEYVMSEGNPDVILCERGIRTFEKFTRNTLDLSAVPVLKRESHLPVVVDPSHGVGRWDLVAPMSRAAVAAGADGLLLEVHADPAHAVSDGPQSLTPKRFQELMGELELVARAVGRNLY